MEDFGRPGGQRVAGIESGLYAIDLRFQGSPAAIVTYSFQGDGGWVLTDIGPSTVRSGLDAGLAELGISLADVRRIMLTHIHLDHGGGIGTLIRDAPWIRVSVHADAAAHLADPTALLKSATRSFGHGMGRLWGEVIGVPAERIDAILPGDVVPGTTAEAVETPGHAGTHLSYMDSASGVLFTGDAAHARLAGSDVIVPTLAPPELDFDAWAISVERMVACRPRLLALPHGGVFADATAHLDAIMPRIHERLSLAEEVLRSREDMTALEIALRERLQASYAAESDADAEWRLDSMEYAMPAYLGAQGLVRWFSVHRGLA